jgi:hypothetical protein
MRVDNNIYRDTVDSGRLGRWQDPRKIAPRDPYQDYGFSPVVAAPIAQEPTPLVDAAMGQAQGAAPPMPLLQAGPSDFEKLQMIGPYVSEDPLQGLARARVRRKR